MFDITNLEPALHMLTIVASSNKIRTITDLMIKNGSPVRWKAIYSGEEDMEK